MDSPELAYFPGGHGFNSLSPPPKSTFPYFWSGTLNLARWSKIRPKLPRMSRWARHKSRLGSAGGDSVTALQTSFDPVEGWRTLQRHKWRPLDLQHLVTAGFVVFSLSMTPISILFKLAVVVVYSFLLLMPATRQFFFPSLPIWTYLLYFFSSR
jgi:inositol phosphorylceramide synthase catalytic subunit